MKNTIKLLAAAAILAFAGNAFAQNSATATGTANATIISPIQIVGTSVFGSTLAFGNIVSTTGGGTVSESGGTDNYSGDPGSDPGAGNYGSIHDAVFHVFGQTGASFAYSSNAVSGLPAGFTVALNGANGTSTIGSPFSTLTVTGTLTVPANAGAQNVSGTWTETAAYN